MTAGTRRGAPAVARSCRAVAAAAGAAGSLACGASMLLAAAGASVSAAATGMTAMPGTGGAPRHGLLGVLVRTGPWLLIASALLITAAFALSRRPRAAVPGLLAGALLYWGMYAQPSLTLMYLSIAVGYTGWAALYLWVRGKPAARRDRGHRPATSGRTR
jgi:hypothetical protein